MNIYSKVILALIAFLIFSVSFRSSNGRKERLNTMERDESEDNPQARLAQEFLMLRDPVTNAIPKDIFSREQEFAKTLPKRNPIMLMKGTALKNAAALTWTERGPNNVGGRTRALGVDVSNSNVIIAGGVSGGLWKSTNAGTSWTQSTTLTQLHSVSCLAQDIRFGKTNTWYAGGGEYLGNSASTGGASFGGDGISKSTDNGTTWTQLSSTVSGTPQFFDNNFDYVWNIAVDSSNGTEDEVYAATYNAIYRSTDGGNSWTIVQGNASPVSSRTEVKVTSNGVVYAALSNVSGVSPAGGIKRSVDGITWTNITPLSFPTAYARMAIGIAPSNENIVYFLVQGTNGTNNVSQQNGHQLWKYTFTPSVGSGDGTEGNGGVWLNRGVNLPIGGMNELFDTQGGYDILCQVKPDNADFVLIGGTNLYRSTDGFADTLNTARIGGYDPNFLNGTYPNHHPDIHSGMFKPGSSIIYYSGNDGGIAVTQDVTTTIGGGNPVTWTSLNSSYNVTQFYAVSLAPEFGSNFIIAGAQDNGNRYTSSSGLSNWNVSPEGGDGTFSRIAPVADDRVYVETQLGRLRSRYRNFTLIDLAHPGGGAAGALNQLFVNPNVLDPNNSLIMYYAGGNPNNSGVWRNDSIKSLTPLTHWTYLTSSFVGATQVSALGISTANNPNVLYYGMSTGSVGRLDNANVGASPAPTSITPGLPSGGYVSCIAVDPTNSNNAIVVFSNYNFQSLWYTTDGGTTWTDVEGNLAGASGPSVRWATIFYVNGVLHVFIGTSVGVYFTNVLNGGSTVWTQEASTSIGNVVTTMLDYRAADNILVAATHGRGVFSTQISVPLPVELAAFAGELKGSSVTLYWQTATEADIAGFEVERNTGAEWAKVGFVSASGSSNSTRSYSYVDRLYEMQKAGSVKYRLKLIEKNGTFRYSGEVEIVITSVAASFVLNQNYPNPFNPTTVISFQLPVASKVSLKILDLLGREVATLFSGDAEAGKIYRSTFDGSKLASGVYFSALESGGKRLVKKLLLLK